MKTIIFLFIIAAFIQSSFLPLNLVLIMLICRSLVIEETVNYYLALGSGLLLGILSPLNLGFWPLLFIVIVKLVQLLRKLPVLANLFTVLPISFLILTAVLYLQQLFFGQSIDFKLVVIETLLVLPTFIFFRFWEERFIIKPELKLRIKN